MSTPATTSTDSSTSPAELRAMFGANLKHLCREAPSISALCRDLGINRTQFNRYLSGESFPRPDVLHRICTFFDVDARILLEPVDQIATTSGFAMHHPELAGFLGPDITRIDQELLPDRVLPLHPPLLHGPAEIRRGAGLCLPAGRFLLRARP